MSRSVTGSPLTPRDISEKLSNAESRREELKKLRKENIDEKLATVQSKKEELINEKSNKVKEVKSSVFLCKFVEFLFLIRAWRAS